MKKLEDQIGTKITWMNKLKTSNKLGDEKTYFAYNVLADVPFVYHGFGPSRIICQKDMSSHDTLN